MTYLSKLYHYVKFHNSVTNDAIAAHNLDVWSSINNARQLGL